MKVQARHGTTNSDMSYCNTNTKGFAIPRFVCTYSRIADAFHRLADCISFNEDRPPAKFYHCGINLCIWKYYLISSYNGEPQAGFAVVLTVLIILSYCRML